MFTLSFIIRAGRQINLRKLNAKVKTDVGEYDLRWTAEPHGNGYVYWSDLVARGTSYDVSFNAAALGDATMTWREI